MIFLRFDNGTITLNCPADFRLPEELEEFFQFDPRSGNFRAPAYFYAPAVLALRAAGIKFSDEARDYELLNDLQMCRTITPYCHQQTALDAWCAASCRGVVSLPTGSGKTILAVMAIAKIRRPAIILVPTIDLLTQWAATLEKFFSVPVGMLGGGSHQTATLTVSTYESALRNMDLIGNRFGLLIADECHHLPAPETSLAASMAVAPFRLGLSATVELEVSRAEKLRELIGETVCDIGIEELEGKVLSHYRVCRMRIPLSADEHSSYMRNRSAYTSFVRSHGINFSSPGGWGNFITACNRFKGGREAFNAFIEQRRIARCGKAKLETVEQLLIRHSGERTIIFTADNDTAYAIGRRFILPVLTHHTKAAERKDFLDCFRSGQYPVLVTSKVLNEGVDVPAAAVGIIVSGSGSVREHVQRLGRILRPSAGKTQAVLYELVSADTSEESVSDRRREHRAYRRR